MSSVIQLRLDDAPKVEGDAVERLLPFTGKLEPLPATVELGNGRSVTAVSGWRWLLKEIALSREAGIYCWLRTCMGGYVAYVGSARNVNSRMSRELRDLQRGKFHNPRMQSAFTSHSSYGSWAVALIETPSLAGLEHKEAESVLAQREAHWIEVLGGCGSPFLFNVTSPVKWRCPGLEASRMGGRIGGCKTVEKRIGIFGMTPEAKTAARSKGGKISGRISGRKAGRQNFKKGIGIFGMTPEAKSEAARKGARKCFEDRKGIFAMTPEQRVNAGHKGMCVRWHGDRPKDETGLCVECAAKAAAAAAMTKAAA